MTILFYRLLGSNFVILSHFQHSLTRPGSTNLSIICFQFCYNLYLTGLAAEHLGKCVFNFVLINLTVDRTRQWHDGVPFFQGLCSSVPGVHFFLSPVLTSKMSEVTPKRRVFRLCQKYMQFFKNQLKNLAFFFICKKEGLWLWGVFRNGLFLVDSERWNQGRASRARVCFAHVGLFPNRCYEREATFLPFHPYLVGKQP